VPVERLPVERPAGRDVCAVADVAQLRPETAQVERGLGPAGPLEVD
jgi:hypothetical protein